MASLIQSTSGRGAAPAPVELRPLPPRTRAAVALPDGLGQECSPILGAAAQEAAWPQTVARMATPLLEQTVATENVRLVFPSRSPSSFLGTHPFQHHTATLLLFTSLSALFPLLSRLVCSCCVATTSRVPPTLLVLLLCSCTPSPLGPDTMPPEVPAHGGTV